MTLKDYLQNQKAKIEDFISTHLSKVSTPQVFAEALRYSFKAGGKRIRPILCLASYEACSLSPSDAIVPLASAIEFIHTYSLIHDDLPAMDNDDLRRGMPTNHKVFGDAMAILAGDGLLTEAFAIMSDEAFAPLVTAQARLRAIKELATSAGIYGMVAGQAQDLLSENSPPDAQTLHFIHTHKTSALLTASVKIGAILAEAKSTQLQAIAEYGQSIGLAFQIVDDILDIEGSTAELGKPQGSDIKSKKMTWPVVHGMQASKAHAQALLKQALQALEGFGSSADPLRWIAEHLDKRKS